MFEKNLRVGYLLDFYGDVLDEHIRDAMRAYYEDDLSLGEIADGIGISRQGVRYLIKKGEDQLTFLESRLGLAARNEELVRIGQELNALQSELAAKDDGSMAEQLRAIGNAADFLLNKNT